MDYYAEDVNNHLKSSGSNISFAGNGIGKAREVIKQVAVLNAPTDGGIRRMVNKFLLENRGTAFNFKFLFNSSDSDFDVMITFDVYLEDAEKIKY